MKKLECCETIEVHEDLLKIAKALYNIQVAKFPWIKNYSLSKFGVKLSKIE